MTQTLAIQFVHVEDVIVRLTCSRLIAGFEMGEFGRESCGRREAAMSCLIAGFEDCDFGKNVVENLTMLCCFHSSDGFVRITPNLIGFIQCNKR